MLDAEVRSRPRLVTRRALLRGVAGAAGAAALGGAAFGATELSSARHRIRRLRSFAPPANGRLREFISRPDLHPPAATVTGGAGGTGYVFLGPGATPGGQAGTLLLDEQGEPVWFQPVPRALWLSNFRLSHYKGQPVLTWWQGKMTREGFGRGEGVIVDHAYRELARVRAGNNRHIDVHEFMLTPQGTALFVCYPESVPADLSFLGGPTDGIIQQSIIQEVDVESGRLLLEWRSLEHISVDESYQRPATPLDYIHVNSIEIAPDGNLLVSARCTWTLYKLDRRTGQVIWRLGGKRSDFQLGSDTQFSWQHDARQPTASTITLFDDGEAAFDDGSGMSETERQSRGVVLQVDEARRTVRLARSYRHPRPLLANAMGSFQTLPHGHVLIGWGSEPVTSEFSPDGRLLADVRLGRKSTSYRAYRYPWAGTPAHAPAIAARRTGRRGDITLYASWNGATAVAHWLVRAGRRPSELRAVGIATRQGFETAIPLGVVNGFVQASAVDASGRVLGTSSAIRV